MTTTLSEILVNLHAGNLDEHLDVLDREVDARKSTLRHVSAAVIQPGDRVRLANLSPQYLNGRCGIVKERPGSRIKVEIDPGDRNIRGKGPRYINPSTGFVTVPETCVEAIR